MAFKPKMLIFSHVSNPSSITGAEKLLLFFCGQMTPYFDCVLVAPNEGRLTILARQSGITVKIHRIPLFHSVYTPGSNLLAEANKLMATSVFRGLMKWIAGEAPEVILTNTCVHFMPAAAGKRLGIPVVWQLTEKITENGNAHLATSLIHQYSNWLVSISESVAESFPVEVRQSKMTVLPPSWIESDIQPAAWATTRASFRGSLGITANQPLIGMISSFLIESKGVHHFIDMALSLKDAYPDAAFLIVGSALNPDYDILCRDRIASAGAQHRFIFAGSQDDITQVYCALDVVVVPSLIPEGFGLTALEGLLHGKPVVAYASGGLQEVLTAAGCPHLLAIPGSPASLAEKVRFILDQPDRGEALGMQNRLQIQAVFGPEVYGMRLNGMVSRWMNEYPAWFQVTARRVKRRVVPARRRKQNSRRKKRSAAVARRLFVRRRTKRPEGRATRRRASRLRLRRTSARRRKA